MSEQYKVYDSRLEQGFECELEDDDLLVVGLSKLNLISFSTYSEASTPIYLGVNQIDNLIEFLQQCKTHLEQ